MQGESHSFPLPPHTPPLSPSLPPPIFLFFLLYLQLLFLSETVFGCNLTKLAEREKSVVPRFMLHFIQYIEKKGLQVVGIYRLSGNAAEIQKLRYLVEEGEPLCMQ